VKLAWPLRVRQLARAVLACAATLALAACSTARPWVNQPVAAASPAAVAPRIVPVFQPTGGEPAGSIIAAVALSGGGARAAAFGLVVLEELRATRFELDGRQTTLLDEIGLISGVSGGSILAGYYAAFGDEVFTRFEPDFLLVNVQSNLIGDLASPGTLYKLTSPCGQGADTPVPRGCCVLSRGASARWHTAAAALQVHGCRVNAASLPLLPRHAGGDQWGRL